MFESVVSALYPHYTAPYSRFFATYKKKKNREKTHLTGKWVKCFLGASPLSFLLVCVTSFSVNSLVTSRPDIPFGVTLSHY